MAREHETIVAPATPLGRSALAIVRIDGPDANRIAGDLAAASLEERIATRVDLRDGSIDLDEAVAVRFVGPRSFTGNDLVELTLHGSPELVSRLIDAVLARGARAAEPGEFTERAVLNGKLDLTQAEAIADLVDSRTAIQRAMSLRHLRGELSDLAGAVREELLAVISRLEAALDFADEGYRFIDVDEARRRLADAESNVARLAASYARGRATRAGLTAVLLGRPNAGKSTLLNFLCGSDRAIVTPEPGTTRDLLRETVEIGGLPVTFVDTAGLRAQTGLVETEGIRRAKEAASSADIVFYLVDASEGMTDADRSEIDAMDGAIVVFTKVDLAKPPGDGIAISVPGRLGLEAFLETVDRTIRERFAVPEGQAAIVNARQKRSIDDCLDGIRSAIGALEGGASEEIVVVDLQRASNALGLLVGAIGNEEVLEEIFSKFCIGK